MGPHDVIRSQILILYKRLNVTDKPFLGDFGF